MLLDDFATPLTGASAVQPHTGAGSSTVTQKLSEARTATKNDKESNAMIDFEQAARSTSSTLSQDECGDTMHELRDMLSGSGQPQTQGCSKNPPAAPAAPPAQPDSKDSKESNDTNVTPMTNVTIIPDYYSLQCVESAMKATGLTCLDLPN